MHQGNKIIYPRIAEEVVNYQELQDVWNCSLCTAYRILHGKCYPNHKRKKQLSEYLGIPVDELWIISPWFEGFQNASMSRLKLTEEERREHFKQYQHEYYLTKTKQKRAERKRAKDEESTSSEV